MEYFEFRAMNSDILLGAEAAPERAAAGFQAAREFIAASEQRLTRFSEDSELSQLNRAQGKWFPASPALFALVGLARTYFYQTGGLFDPSILGDLKKAGYDRSMDEIRASGSQAPVQSWPGGSRTRPAFGGIRLEEDTSCIWLPPGVEIDLGGIAKGWIAEQAARILKEYAPAGAASAGGDMCLLGLPEGQSHWEVALEDPRNPEGTLGVLKVGPGAVATSSVTKRSWRQGDKQQHHLIDPRSGEPAETSWLSVTLVAPLWAAGSPGTAAEVFAKALLIAGPDRATEIITAHRGLAFIAVDRHGKLWGSPNSMEYMNVNA